MTPEKIIQRAFLSLVLFLASFMALAQTEEQKLTATILHLDSAFWNAYNNCDTLQFKNYLADDVEFYHDKGGITLGAGALIGSLNKNLCSNPNYRLRREAIPATVKVFPMHNGDKIYGAIISGEHLFYITADGKPEYLDGDADFMQLWLQKNGEWKMARILSYNHHDPGYKNARREIELPSKTLDQLVGRYKSEKFGTMAVSRSGKNLVLEGNNSSFTLYPLAGDSFFTKERDLVFQFVKDAKGKPVKMTVTEHGALADELLFQGK